MFEFEREKLIEELSKSGITDPYVLKAFSIVRRELFIPEALMHRAYENTALPIGKGQTISQPYTIAVMMQELKLRKNQKILEVGTGSGYQAALLKALGLFVYSVERDYDLFLAVRDLFAKMDLNIACRYGDGTIGWSEFAPYDGIIVTAGAPSVPRTLMNQLKINGRMVIPVGDISSQNLYVVTRTAENDFDTKQIPAFRFVPLIGKEGWDNDKKIV